MAQWNRILPLAALLGFAMLAMACLPGGGSSPASPTPAAPLRADIQAVQTSTASTPTITPSPTQLPVLPQLTTYTVKSGDFPNLIAENVGVPADQREAWVNEMLSLNGVDATSLQIGQELILPPYGDGTLPNPSAANTSSEAAPPAAVLEPAATQPPPSQPAATDTPVNAAGGVPFAPTPPFVGFTQLTATPTPTSTPTPTATASPTPTPTPTSAVGKRAWLTSTADTAKYYYCDLDQGWRDIPPDKLQAFDSEQQLLAVWGRFRTKAPDSVC